ncbi:hypothetical protein [Anaerosalibacter massiliensis]|uniref:Uncharacterized protein n=1 Tax=Anaerosalibacter massiliensis TaxID=1347392 RepID=A0A9X2MJK0_9FIRM|nr:hypothetical protein [Anaerosalibacter massiliensis]MCR2045215.1 hypothetical protein [Anaerosalibacter massiliensis]
MLQDIFKNSDESLLLLFLILLLCFGDLGGFHGGFDETFIFIFLIFFLFSGF